VTESHDVAVIGLGLVGAAALRHLAAAGVSCVGVGPTEPVDWSIHDGVFASHYDSGRITRRLDARREWAVLAGRAIAEYGGVEQVSGITFHFPVGVVIAEVDPQRLQATTEVAAGLGVDFDRFEPGERIADERIQFPATATVLTEPGPGGFIDPRRMLAAQLSAARRHRAAIVDEEVVGVEPRQGGGWVVRTRSRSVGAAQIVIATGPHADELAGLPMRPQLEVVAETVVLAQVSGGEQRRLAGLPSIIVDDPDHDHLYIVPPTEYPDGKSYVKLGATRRREVLTSRMRGTSSGCVG
jgi:sarcosine oxidase